MSNLIKTTITMPEELMQLAKLTALKEKKTLSDLLREAVSIRVQKADKKLTKTSMKFLGAYKIGIKKLYNKRSDLYEKSLKRKMGF